MDTKLLIFLILAELISAFLIYRVVTSSMSVLSKVALSLMLLVPVIGPVIYGLGIDVPPSNKEEFQRLNAHDQVYRHRHYQTDFKNETEKIKQKIKRAKG